MPYTYWPFSKSAIFFKSLNCYTHQIPYLQCQYYYLHDETVVKVKELNTELAHQLLQLNLKSHLAHVCNM